MDLFKIPDEGDDVTESSVDELTNSWIHDNWDYLKNIGANLGFNPKTGTTTTETS